MNLTPVLLHGGWPLPGTACEEHWKGRGETPGQPLAQLPRPRGLPKLNVLF